MRFSPSHRPCGLSSCSAWWSIHWLDVMSQVSARPVIHSSRLHAAYLAFHSSFDSPPYYYGEGVGVGSATWMFIKNKKESVMTTYQPLSEVREKLKVKWYRTKIDRNKLKELST